MSQRRLDDHVALALNFTSKDVKVASSGSVSSVDAASSIEKAFELLVSNYENSTAESTVTAGIELKLSGYEGRLYILKQ